MRRRIVTTFDGGIMSFAAADRPSFRRRLDTSLLNEESPDTPEWREHVAHMSAKLEAQFLTWEPEPEPLDN